MQPTLSGKVSDDSFSTFSSKRGSLLTEKTDESDEVPSPPASEAHTLLALHLSLVPTCFSGGSSSSAET